MRWFGLLIAAAIVITGLTATGGPASAEAAINRWPHSVVEGFATPNGSGFWLIYADGTVTPQGSAVSYGDASSVPLNAPIVGGAVTPNGKGYWLVAQDGGVFTFGNAHFYGSMGATHLAQPVFSIVPTKTGHGYWLVARDGGIFTFGDAKFYGSTGNLVLNAPITGMTTSFSGKGYRMVAADGGIFSFGDAPFYGSLPGLGITANDVVGMAQIASNVSGYWTRLDGYWIARADGEVYSLGYAQIFQENICNRIAAIFSNPFVQGYRLVTESGATIPFGRAPGGDQPTGNPQLCATTGLISLAEYDSINLGDSYQQVATLIGGSGGFVGVWNRNAATRTYQWFGEGHTLSNGPTATITFRDNRVISKTETGLS